jgi:hypothetical protein
VSWESISKASLLISDPNHDNGSISVNLTNEMRFEVGYFDGHPKPTKPEY